MSIPIHSLLVVVSKERIIDADALNAVSDDTFEVIEVSDTLAASALLSSSSNACAWVVHESMEAEEAAELFANVDSQGVGMPLLYVTKEGGILSGFGTVLPDVVLDAPLDPADLVRNISGLLSRDVFSRTLLDVITDNVTRTISDSFIPDASVDKIWFRAGHAPMHLVNATIPFCGPAVSGRISVSTSTDTLKSVYARLVPDTPEVVHRVLEDLVGEMANQILGGLKRGMSAGGIDFALGVPMMYTGDKCPVRYRTRNGSTLLRVHGQKNASEEIAVGLSLDSVRKDYEATDEDEVETGELAFF